MLNTIDCTPSLATKDLRKARAFYAETLGLKEIHGDESMTTFESGATRFSVYVSDYAGTNKATALTWAVGDKLDACMRDLRAKGITFEHYDDIPEMKRDGDIHVADGIRAAWFKDPDGNILNLVDM